MINSMTGYGRSESTGYDWNCLVELKSVNHRYFDATIRIPSMMNSYEDQIRKILAKEVRRGKVDAYVKIESLGSYPVKIDVNISVTDAYIKAMHKLLERYTVPDQATLSLLATYPDVFTVDKSLSDESKSRLWTVLERAVGQACDQLNTMRLTEGTAIYADIMVKRTKLSDMLKQVCDRLPEAALEHKNRIQKRVDEVLAQLPGSAPDEARMLMEMALYIDRTSIDEEITRLKSHLSQLDKIAAEKSPIGRKMDFLVQEMQREVNTIGSKTGDIEISTLVIDMKSEIEKIREQVQNVE